MYEEITKETYNRIAPRYSESTIFPVFRRMIEGDARRMLEIIPKGPQSSLLIVGCGDGRDYLLFKDHVEKVAFLDYSLEMMKIASENYPEVGCYLEDFRDMNNIPSQSFDSVWASTCLYHVQRKYIDAVAENLWRVLKPGGYLYVNFKTGSGETLLSEPPSFPSGGSRFYSFYSEDELRTIFGKFIVQFCQTDNKDISTAYIRLTLKK